MITFFEVSVIVPNGRGNRSLFSDVTLNFGADERVGILAAPGTGKTTLARVASKAEPPSTGHVFHEGKVSWPVGHTGIFHTELSALDNLNIIGQAIGENPHKLTEVCLELGFEESRLNVPLRLATPIDRRILAFGTSMGVHFDYYVADDALIMGDGKRRETYEQILSDRLSCAGLLYVSRTVSHLKRFCDRFLVLKDGIIKPCHDLEMEARGLNLIASADARNAEPIEEEV